MCCSTDITRRGQQLDSGPTQRSVKPSTTTMITTTLAAGSVPVRRRMSLNRIVDMVRTKDRTQSLTTIIIISTIFVFITLTTTCFVAVVCCKRNAVFALSSRHRHRRRGSGGRRSSKSTGSGSRDCEHCEMERWRYSPTAIPDTSQDDGEVIDSPIYDDAVHPGQRSRHSTRKDEDQLVVRWLRNSVPSSLSLAGWDVAGSRVTLLSRGSSTSGETGSGYDVTSSPMSDFRCSRSPEVGCPSAEGDSASADGEDAGSATSNRKQKRKWKRHLAVAESNYRRLEDED